MSRWWSDLAGGADLCLTGSGCALLQPGGTGQRVALPHGAPTGPLPAPQELEQALHALAPSLAGRRGLRVWLGGSLVYQATVPVDAAALSRRDLLALLSAHWQSTLGDEPGPVAVSYAVQQGGDSVMTSCVPLALLDALRLAAQACGLRLRQVEPFASRVWASHRREVAAPAGYLVVCDDDAVSMGAFARRRWAAWAGESWSGGTWSELARRVRRFIRYHGLQEDLPVWVHAGASPCGEPAAAGLEHWTLLGARPVVEAAP